MDAIEFLDVIDEKGLVVGSPVLRSEVHKKGLWHRAVHVWVVNDKGELLIQKRSENKENHPGMWDIPAAGHITTGHEPLESAIREVEEELGIAVAPKDLIKLGERKSSSTSNGGLYINNELNDIYIVETTAGVDKMKIQAEEVAEVKFINPRDLKAKIDSKDPEFVLHPEEYALLFKHLGVKN